MTDDLSTLKARRYGCLIVLIGTPLLWALICLAARWALGG